VALRAATVLARTVSLDSGGIGRSAEEPRPGTTTFISRVASSWCVCPLRGPKGKNWTAI